MFRTKKLECTSLLYLFSKVILEYCSTHLSFKIIARDLKHSSLLIRGSIDDEKSFITLTQGVVFVPFNFREFLKEAEAADKELLKATA
jgi:hypothetical protein